MSGGSMSYVRTTLSTLPRYGPDEPGDHPLRPKYSHDFVDTVVVEDLEGVNFEDAPIPSEDHACSVQTRVFPNGPKDDARVERCACGGIRTDGSKWTDRNSHRAAFPERLVQ